MAKLLKRDSNLPLQVDGKLVVRNIENIPGDVMRISSHEWGMTLNIDTNSTGGDSFRITRGSGSSETTLLIINDGNNVGIGTANPSEKLDVNGRIKATNLGYLGEVIGTVSLADHFSGAAGGSQGYGSTMRASPVQGTSLTSSTTDSAGTDLSQAYTKGHVYAFGNAFMLVGSTYVVNGSHHKPLFFSGERFLWLTFPLTPILNAFGLSTPDNLVFNVMAHTDFYGGPHYFTDWDQTSYNADAMYVVMHYNTQSGSLYVTLRRLRFTGSDGYLRPVIQVIGHRL